MNKKIDNIYVFSLLVSIPFALKYMVLLTGWTGYLLQSLYKIGQLLTPLLWRKVYAHKTGFDIFWPKEATKMHRTTMAIATLCAVCTASAAIVTIISVSSAIGIEPEDIYNGLQSRFSVSPLAAVLIVLFLCIGNSLLEELHFRWWIDRELSAKFGNTFGMCMSAFLFGAMHILIFWGIPVFTPLVLTLVCIALMIGGVLWSWILRMPGGLYGAWWSHCLSNLILMNWGLWWLGFI